MILCPRTHRRRPGSDAALSGRHTTRCNANIRVLTESSVGFVVLEIRACKKCGSRQTKSHFLFYFSVHDVRSQTQFLPCTPFSVNNAWTHLFNSLFKELLKLPRLSLWREAVSITELNSSFITYSKVSTVLCQALEGRENISYNTFIKQRQRCFSAYLKHCLGCLRVLGIYMLVVWVL